MLFTQQDEPPEKSGDEDEDLLMRWWRLIPTLLWMAAAGFAVGALIALS